MKSNEKWGEMLCDFRNDGLPKPIFLSKHALRTSSVNLALYCSKCVA